MATTNERFKEQFAAIPVSVLESSAWKTLPHSAKTTLTILAGQYMGSLKGVTNFVNGPQNLSRVTCRRFGLEHSLAHKAAKLLEARGLIDRTYTARYTASKSRIPTMWALGWRDITHRNNDLLGRIEKAPNRWRHWTPVQEIKSGQIDSTADCIEVESTTHEPQICGHVDTAASESVVDLTNLSKNLGVDYARTTGGRQRCQR